MTRPAPRSSSDPSARDPKLATTARRGGMGSVHSTHHALPRMNRAGEPRRITPMLRRTLLALGIGSVVFMTAPAAFSDEAPVLLTPVGFDDTTGILSAYEGT